MMLEARDLQGFLTRLPRALSGLGRTRAQRSALLLAGFALAFAIGRWTSVDGSQASPSRFHDVPPSVRGTPLVLDGDTLDFDGLRVRLFGIDAPERDQLCEDGDGSRYACGITSREALVEVIDHAPVRCTRKDVDRYGRMVAVCEGRNGDLGARMVERGDAIAYRHYSNDYVDEEASAKSGRLGLWQGKFEAPWDWRRHGEEAAGR
jgi:endonuclease YncB( thermonuclease family)